LKRVAANRTQRFAGSLNADTKYENGGPVHECIISYQLAQNYPNPFNPSTQISFALSEAGEVTLAIYSMNGQLVKRLVAGEMSAGRHSFVWEATDERGLRVAAGFTCTF